MAGVYVHIPFCKSRCSYCDFHSSTDLSLRERYVHALCREMDMRREYLHGEAVKTVYVGGGTPSLIDGELLRVLFGKMAEVHGLEEVEECTIECNPDDISEDFLAGLKELPINRISMGVQSFDDNELKAVCRRHDARQAIEAVRLCQKYGYKNISIDLILGLPYQTRERFERSLRKAVELDVQHLSVYGLSYEEGTPLWKAKETGIVVPMDEDDLLEEFALTRRLLREAGFVQYEISNYAKEGFRSKHNSSYWSRIPYIGYGSGAHSFYGAKREWNIADVKGYCTSMEAGKRAYEEERLSVKDVHNEKIMLGLRTKEGVSLEGFSGEEQERLLTKVKPFVTNGEVCCENGRIALTEKGIDVADGIIRELFL